MTTAGTRPFNADLKPIRENFLATGDALTALAERTAQVDHVVLDAAERLLFPIIPKGLALLSVGGYGRRQLFPYSDIDLLLLFESERLVSAHKEAISSFLQSLWDAGLRMSHSVRTPAECVEVHDQNIELNVSLLDQRFLTGDRTLYASLAAKLPRFIHANRDALIRNLSKLTRERHSKYADTFYHLEPNVKETPGGLRDYQLVCWLQQLHNTDAARLGVAEPAPELLLAFKFMARLRCYLHCQSNRDNNALSFDAQDAIAELWQHVDAAHWMREYYRQARAVCRAALRVLEENEAQASSLFSQFRDRLSRLSNADFSVLRERVHFRSPQRLDVEPELVLRLYEFIARHGIRPALETDQRIESRLSTLRQYFHESRPLWPTLNQILSLPHAPLAVRSMHESGVLTAIFPEMEQIECLVTRDFYHRYTVDEHTLVTLQNIAGLRGAEDLPNRSFANLLSEVKQPGLLLFALMFHDVGKGATGEGHVDGSLRMVQPAMARIQMPEHDRDTVQFLIGAHLDLSAAMQSRDMFDPQTIREVAQQVRTLEWLRLLTLLTWADISAVNPTAMTAWRAEQLHQLYLMTANELTRTLESDRIEAVPSGPPQRIEFLQGFPTRYLRTHTDAEIDGHMALEEESRKRGVAVDIRKLDSAWQLTLLAQDRTGLFAAIAGTLSSFGMNILKAEAFSNRRGLILDTFTFADLNRQLDLNPSEIERLQNTAERVVTGKTDVTALLRNRPKPTLPSRKARISASVHFDAEASNSATLVEIVAEDRPGLLYDLASAISSNGSNIEVVLIDTQAHKAIDVFYVTAEGKKLGSAKRQILQEDLQRACQPTI